MPHIIGKNPSTINYPLIVDSCEFLFEVSSMSNTMIACKFQKRNFFIQKQKRISSTDNEFIIKGEKHTRPSPLIILQNSIYLYANITKLEIIKTNISYQKIENDISNKVKDISYFQDFDFSKYEKIIIEIGFGSGRHILDLASKNPSTLHIGLEIYKPSLTQVSNLIEIKKLDNLILCDHDARSFIKMLPNESINAIYVHFPVPWDKKPKRRIFSDGFISDINLVLKNDAKLMLRTDSDNYYDFVISLFKDLDLNVLINKNKDINISSKYEDRWKKLNKTIYDVIYTKTSKNNAVSINKGFKIASLKLELDIKDFLKQANLLKNKMIKLELIKKFGFIKIKEIYTNHNSQERIILHIIFGNETSYENIFLTFHKNRNNYIIDYFPNPPSLSSINIELENILISNLGIKL